MKNAADRVIADYREMPGLCVTVPQGARLWGLSLSDCQRVLTALVADGQLYRDDRGLYLRRDAPARRRIARAPLDRAADRAARVANRRR